MEVDKSWNLIGNTRERRVLWFERYIINTCEAPNDRLTTSKDLVQILNGPCTEREREREREAMKKVGNRKTQGKKREGWHDFSIRVGEEEWMLDLSYSMRWTLCNNVQWGDIDISYTAIMITRIIYCIFWPLCWSPKLRKPHAHFILYLKKKGTKIKEKHYFTLSIFFSWFELHSHRWW